MELNTFKDNMFFTLMIRVKNIFSYSDLQLCQICKVDFKIFQKKMIKKQKSKIKTNFAQSISDSQSKNIMNL
ncbi:hypothetical protein HY04_03825 [Kaistella antarctica]|uniref:Uncharacterized protein n=1 Tax=Kaistella antarctica TaxID=266748 RepID=A0ABR4U2C5_9FLAO|nr:hypothetical protein HY04_03825 [Kaistella antarctica]